MMSMKWAPLAILTVLAGCGDVETPDGVDPGGELITTVVLTFSAAGVDVDATWTDPEADGSPSIDEIVLDVGVDYAMSVAFLNALEDPAEDLTPEIDDEADQHQVFFTGSGIAGPANPDDPAAIVVHAYADQDDGGLPVGLDNDLSALTVGTGDLTVTLRHLPPEGGEAVKVDGLAEAVATGGFVSIGGDDDASVTFPLSVQ